MHALVVEDDPFMASHVARLLNSLGFKVENVGDGGAAVGKIQQGGYQLIVLDRTLPDGDAISLIPLVRSKDKATPILVLSALGEVDHRVEGLRAGSDDYLPKPFASEEFRARVEVLIRRRQDSAVQSRISYGPFDLDLFERNIRCNDNAIELTKREFRLMEYLIRNAGCIVTRSMILANVWDYQFDPQTNIIDQHIAKLRSKVGAPWDAYIHTERGVGYGLMMAPK